MVTFLGEFFVDSVFGLKFYFSPKSSLGDQCGWYFFFFYHKEDSSKKSKHQVKRVIIDSLIVIILALYNAMYQPIYIYYIYIYNNDLT